MLKLNMQRSPIPMNEWELYVRIFVLSKLLLAPIETFTSVTGPNVLAGAPSVILSNELTATPSPNFT